MGNLAWEMLLELLRYCASLKDSTRTIQILLELLRYCVSVKDIARTVQILLELLRYCASVKDFACTAVGDVATLLLSISPQQVRRNKYKGAGSFHIHRETMKELCILAVLGIREQPNLAQNLVTHRH